MVMILVIYYKQRGKKFRDTKVIFADVFFLHFKEQTEMCLHISFIINPPRWHFVSLRPVSILYAKWHAFISVPMLTSYSRGLLK